MIEEQNFLKGYEISGLELNKRMYRIVAFAAVVFIVPMLALSQTNMLSKSACESAFVNDVCEVLDTVYIGSKMLAKNTGYVNEEYEQAELAEAKVIWTEIMENPEPPLEYPEGYFLVANPEDYITEDDPNLLNAFNSPPPVSRVTPPVNRPSRIRPPARRNNRSTTRKPKFPKPNKSRPKIDDDLNMDIFGEDDKNQVAKNNSDGTNGKKPDTKVDPTPKKQNDVEKKSAITSETLSDVKVNKQPLLDLADIVLEKSDTNQIDLKKNFQVKMVGYIDENGKLLGEKSRFAQVEDPGDQAMVALVKDAIAKVGSTGWLKYLADEGASELEMTFGQTDEAMNALVRSEYGNEKRAKQAVSAIKTLIAFTKKFGKDRLKPDEMELLKLANVKQDGKFLVIQFDLEKPRAHEMITARLDEHRKNKQKKQDEANKAGKSSTVVPNDKNAAATAGR